MKGLIIIGVLVVVSILGFFALNRRSEPLPVEQPVTENLATVERNVTRRTRVQEEIPSPPTLDSATNETISTNLWLRLANGDVPRVSREQLEPFLAKNHRNVEALLGALRASGDDELLKEAKERFPNDPRVQFAAAFKTESPEERQQWLEKLKQSDPNNALANYLLAGEHLKSGKAEQALQEITAASSRRGVDNYLVDFIQSAEEAYRASGHTDAEAKASAGISALLPEQAKLKQVGLELVELARRYQQVGDESSAQSLLQMGLNLGRRLNETPQVTLIQELVGIAIERIALNAMNLNAPIGDSGQTVQNQIDALAARRAAYKELTSKTTPILESMSDEDVAHYFDRAKLCGEVAALRWVMNQTPRP